MSSSSRRLTPEVLALRLTDRLRAMLGAAAAEHDPGTLPRSREEEVLEIVTALGSLGQRGAGEVLRRILVPASGSAPLAEGVGPSIRSAAAAALVACDPEGCGPPLAGALIRHPDDDAASDIQDLIAEHRPPGADRLLADWVMSRGPGDQLGGVLRTLGRYDGAHVEEALTTVLGRPKEDAATRAEALRALGSRAGLERVEKLVLKRFASRELRLAAMDIIDGNGVDRPLAAELGDAERARVAKGIEKRFSGMDDEVFEPRALAAVKTLDGGVAREWARRAVTAQGDQLAVAAAEVLCSAEPDPDDVALIGGVLLGRVPVHYGEISEDQAVRTLREAVKALPDEARSAIAARAAGVADEHLAGMPALAAQAGEGWRRQVSLPARDIPFWLGLIDLQERRDAAAIEGAPEADALHESVNALGRAITTLGDCGTPASQEAVRGVLRRWLKAEGEGVAPDEPAIAAMRALGEFGAGSYDRALASAVAETCRVQDDVWSALQPTGDEQAQKALGELPNPGQRRPVDLDRLRATAFAVSAKLDAAGISDELASAPTERLRSCVARGYVEVGQVNEGTPHLGPAVQELVARGERPARLLVGLVERMGAYMEKTGSSALRDDVRIGLEQLAEMGDAGALQWIAENEHLPLSVRAHALGRDVQGTCREAIVRNGGPEELGEGGLGAATGPDLSPSGTLGGGSALALPDEGSEVAPRLDLDELPGDPDIGGSRRSMEDFTDAETLGRGALDAGTEVPEGGMDIDW